MLAGESQRLVTRYAVSVVVVAKVPLSGGGYSRVSHVSSMQHSIMGDWTGEGLSW